MDQDPQDLFSKAASCLSDSVYIDAWWYCSLEQDFPFPFAEILKVPVCPFLQTIKVPLNTSTSIRYISLSSTFVVTCKLAVTIACPHHPDHYWAILAPLLISEFRKHSVYLNVLLCSQYFIISWAPWSFVLLENYHQCSPEISCTACALLFCPSRRLETDISTPWEEEILQLITVVSL